MASNDPHSDPTATPPPVDGEVLPATTTPPTPPEGVTPAEAEALRAKAAEIVAQLAAATGSKELELVDSVGAVGLQAQRQAGSGLQLLRVRVGEMLSNGGASGQVTKDLVELRSVLDEIAPNSERSLPDRLLRMLPGGSSLAKTLERIAVRYEDVSSQAYAIEKRLRDGETMLRRDNIELRQLYEQIEAQQVVVARNAYLGELLMAELQKLMGTLDDQQKRQRLQNALYDVSMRVQDLKTMQEVHAQFFVSIDMTRENNARLGQAVERTVTLATNTLMVGLAIQSALARQQRVMEATQRTREFLGDLIVTNAAAIKQHTNDIGDIYKNPVVAIDKLQQAHDDLIAALDTADRLKTEGIESARENIAKLNQLATQVEQKAHGIAAPADTTSLEA